MCSAEGAQRADRFDHAELRVGGGLTQVVEQLTGREPLALVVRDPSLALRDHARRQIEDHRRAPRDRDADRERVGAEARVAPAPRRHDRARDHVDEVHRDQARGHRHLGPGADAAQVVRVRERDDAAAVRLRSRDAEFHRLVADHLAEAGVAVEREQGGAVEFGRDVRVGRQPAFEERVRIARQHADAVRIVTGQVGLDQVLGDQLGLARRTAEAAHQLLHGGAQGFDMDRVHRGAHRGCLLRAQYRADRADQAVIAVPGRSGPSRPRRRARWRRCMSPPRRRPTTRARRRAAARARPACVRPHRCRACA